MRAPARMQEKSITKVLILGFYSVEENRWWRCSSRSTIKRNLENSDRCDSVAS